MNSPYTLTTQSPQAEFAAPADPAQGFTLRLAVDLQQLAGDKTLLAIPNVLEVHLWQDRSLDPARPARQHQNYAAFKSPDGSTPVLEATLLLYVEGEETGREMTIGVPLTILPQPSGTHEVTLNFSGVRWTLYVDGALLDNDFPFGCPRWADSNTWRLEASEARQAALHFPALPLDPAPARSATIAAIQYWTPPGHNTWVGDVATLFHEGRYHLFYLYDRRHHTSKFGKGGHYFEHLSTTDFKTWVEHEAATPLEEQWESIGTGAPFVAGGRLCIAYGLHTERFYPDEKTTLPAQMEYIQRHGQSGAFDRRAPGVPIGATYAISQDGVAQFKKTWIFFHPCRNPSVYCEDGKLRMFANYGARGTWEAETVDGGWRCINADFPPGGDCTFFFHWGEFDYIIGGFKDLWMKPAGAPDAAYVDVVSQGDDFYDGSTVPAISEIGDGRFLMAAWIPINGWGGNLVIRELLQYPGGRIGARWMPEIVPATGEAQLLAETIDETASFPTGGRSFLLSFRVQPIEAVQNARLGVVFLPETGEAEACEWQLDLAGRRAQFAPGCLQGFAGGEKSLREGGRPYDARNYAIENLIGGEVAFTVRLIVKDDDKIGGCLVDAEISAADPSIAGQRTMISYRPGLRVKHLLFRAAGAEVKDVQMAAIKDW